MSSKDVLILGVTGMLGHKVTQVMLEHNFSVAATCRRIDVDLPEVVKSKAKVIEGVEANNFDLIRSIIKELKPRYIINCIGIIKQLDQSKEYVPSIEINSLLPHKLDLFAKEFSSKLIHISTDCVFDGKIGGYTEESQSNCLDLYGKSKFLGEVTHSESSLTLRTSIIGHELKSHKSLVDWFIQQETANGFSKAIYSGLTTYEVGNFLAHLIKNETDIFGLYHLTSKKINKLELLEIIKNVYNHPVKLSENSEFKIDRSMVSDKLKKAMGYCAPDWTQMITKMYEDYCAQKSIYLKFVRENV